MHRSRQFATPWLVVGMLIWGAVLFGNPTHAVAKPKVVSTVTGTVTDVVSGDILTLTVEGESRTFRLDGIDAPNKGQPFAEESREAVRDLLLGKSVRVDVLDTTRDGETLGRVWRDKSSVNKYLVTQGLAWHDAPNTSAKSLAAAEQTAKQAKRGLWARPGAVAPWQWVANQPPTDGDAEAVLAVARGFLEAMKDNDVEAAKKLMTKKAAESSSENFKASDEGAERDYELGAVTVTGTTATVVAEISQGEIPTDGTLLLKQESGMWRIYGMSMKLGEDGPEFTIDFENPEKSLGPLVEGLAEGLGEAMKQGFESALGGGAEPPKPLKAVTLEQFSQAWQITDGVENQSAEKALSSLTAELGIELKIGSKSRDAAQETVNVAADTRNHFELIEEICRQINHYPVYKTVFGSDHGGIAMSLKAGQRPHPVSFAGPFMFEVKEIDEFVPYAAGRIQIIARSVRFPDGVMQLTDTGGMQGTLSIDEVTHAKVGTLLDDRGSGGSFFTGGMFGSSSKSRVFETSYTVGLKNLLREVSVISTLSGGVEVRIPLLVKEFKFDGLDPDQKQTDGDVEVVLASVEGEGPYSAQFKVRGGQEDGTQIVPLDAAGEAMGVVSSGSFGFDNERTSTVTTQEKPSGYSVQVVQRLEKRVFPIEFSDVALTHFAEMPAAIEPLDFGTRDEPLECEFVKITGKEGFRQVLVRVTNHTNKDAGAMTLVLEFLDANGEKLEDTFSTYGGNMTAPGGGPPISVRSSESSEIEFVAFFMPEETKSVRFRVNEVNFADATQWTP